MVPGGPGFALRGGGGAPGSPGRAPASAPDGPGRAPERVRLLPAPPGHPLLHLGPGLAGPRRLRVADGAAHPDGG
ncbi:hypothetical protein D7Y21_38820 [Corallococcus sp. AB045]|nr:hypothetical protein D7Y21_38820 [Corallococcus sp. AB045]